MDRDREHRDEAGEVAASGPVAPGFAGPGAADREAGIGEDVVSRAWASIRSALAELSGAAMWSRSDEAAREGVQDGFAVLQSMEAAWLGLVADLDARPGAVPGARAGTVAASFLRGRLLRTAGQAAADVRAAHALAAGADPARGGLPGLGSAFAAGQVSREHVDLAVRTVRRLPVRVLSQPLPASDPDSAADSPAGTGVSAGAAVDAFFTQHCRKLTSAQVGYAARHLLAALDPDGQDGFDPEATERRSLNKAVDGGGMVTGRFQLDPAGGAWFATAIEHFSAPDPTVEETTEDGHSICIRDTRTAAQRRADALALISRLALGTEDAGTTSGGEPPRIVVHAGVQDVLDALHAAAGKASCGSDGAETACPETDCPETDCPETDQPEAEVADPAGAPARLGRRGADCEPLGPIGPRLLARFACDSVLQKALLSRTGAVLDLGRDTRTVSRAQRRALIARDRGCVIPGCGSPPHWCEAHHVHFWRHGGRTDLANLALVCGRHHTLIHLGIWELVGRDGAVWARPPTWIDPHQRLIRNTLHATTDAARALGTQLRLNLPPDPENAVPGWAKTTAQQRDPGRSQAGDPGPGRVGTGGREPP